MAENSGSVKKKKVLYESQKNFFVCAVLMIVVGVGLFFMSKQGLGCGCIFVGVMFLVAGIVMVKRDGLMTVEVDDSQKHGAKTRNDRTDKIAKDTEAK